MTYPAREFPNLPSFEESCDLWSAGLAQRLPVRRRIVLLVMVLIGVLLMVANHGALMPATQSLLAGSNTWHLGHPAVWFLAGCLLAWAPMAYLPLVFALMPPQPTRESYEKTVALMRAYHALKDPTCP